mmetsp:Transcript_19861/g.42881  ORF Transcript_19861/g.42881 Transcript_19861/m.42881 type:complete len:204 (+) Transcript_19861:1398-2009(+)
MKRPSCALNVPGPPRSICRRHTQCAAAQQASFRGQPSPAPALSWAARKAPAQPRTPALRLGSCTSRPTPAPAWCSAARMATARPCAWFGAACRCCRGGSAARALLRASRESAAACAARALVECCRPQLTKRARRRRRPQRRPRARRVDFDRCAPQPRASCRRAAAPCSRRRRRRQWRRFPWRCGGGPCPTACPQSTAASTTRW